MDRWKQPRQIFDPNNKEHLAEVKYFFDNNKWRNGCPFSIEHPYVEIPAMISNKIAKNFLEQVLV